MDDDLGDIYFAYSDMSRTGSIACLSKRTISNIYECILSCITYISLIYILLVLIGLIFHIQTDFIFQLIGFISIFSLITTPLGIYGSLKGSYCALLTFFLLASYHLYALVMYFWFNIKANTFLESAAQPSSVKSKGYEYLHYISSGSYTLLVGLSILLASCKVISLVNQIDPARVIVVDNNPVE